MNKNILIYSNTGLSSKQIGLTAEVLGKIKASNNKFKMVLCNAVLSNCFFNRVHNNLGCVSCQSRLLKVNEALGIGNEHVVKLKSFREADEFVFPWFNNLDELMSFEYRGIDIGRGAASSIISYKRDFDIDSETYGDLIALELRKSMNVLLFFEKYLQENTIDEVYLFNGRFAEVYPLLQLVIKNKIPFYTIESGSGNNLELYENSLPHSIKLRTKLMLEKWNEAEETKREAIAHNWFRLKKDGTETFARSFIGNQVLHKLPENFDFGKKNIAIFNSSEDELKTIIEWQTDLFKNQNEAIKKIVSHFRQFPKFHFYLRIHPNLAKVENSQIAELRNLVLPNLTIIQASEPIDSYYLMESCDKVLSFASSMGIEASYWQKPSILYGNSFYKDLNATYNPKNFSELVDTLLLEDLKPIPQKNTFIYGYAMVHSGNETNLVQFNANKKIKVNEQNLKNLHLNAISLFFSYFHNFSKWTKAHKALTGNALTLKTLFKYI